MKINLLKCLTLAAALGAAASGRAQTNPATAAAPAPVGPRISFAEPNYDFGRVDSGEIVKHDFVFTNTGDHLLVVQDVRPGCGCTAVGGWDKQVEPGQTGHISIQFNSSGYSGTVHKTVTVLCNETNRPNVYIGLQGAIWKAFDVSPAYAVFNVMPEQPTNQSLVIKITSNNDQPVTVSDPASTSPVFKTELKTVQEGKAYELVVTVDSSEVSGTTSGQITLKTSSAKMPVVSLPSFIMMQPVLAVNPPEMSIPPGPLKSPAQFTVSIINNGSNSITLSDASINKEGATLQVKDLLPNQVPGRQFNVTATFPTGFLIQPSDNILATVKTSNPKYPLITIPVKQPMPTVIAAPPPAPAKAPASASASAAPASVAASPGSH